MAILRALGAAPRTLSGLLIIEALALSVAAAALGVTLSAGLSLIANDFLAARFGLSAEAGLYLTDIQVVLYLIPAALLANLVPAARLYINSINDGIMVRR
jgi:putative ABC transport system permease protein